MRFFAKSLLGAVLLVSASASADVVIVPAASGHYVANSFGLIPTQNDWFIISNNTVCGKMAAEHLWDTPLVLQNMTGGTVDVFASRSTASSSTSKSNAYSVEEDGDISSWTGAKTHNAYLGDVTIPTNGTLFAEAAMNDSLDDVGGCVHQYRVEW